MTDSYSIETSANTISEGETLNVSFSSKTDNQQIIYWSFTGDKITESDFLNSYSSNKENIRLLTNSLSGSELIDPYGNFLLLHSVANDLKVEGNEILQIKFYSDVNNLYQLGDTINIEIIDSSNIPNYLIYPSMTTIEEGEKINTYINITNIYDNQKIYWSIIGEEITNSDFSLGKIKGWDFAYNLNNNPLVHIISKDSLEEGEESFQIKLFTNEDRTEEVANSIEVKIKDYPGSSLHSYIITTPKETIKEGESIDIFFNVNNIPSNEKVYWVFSGEGITNSDFSSNNFKGWDYAYSFDHDPLDRIINTGIVEGSDFIYNLKNNALTNSIANDYLTEGDETVEIKFFKDSNYNNQIGETLEILIEDSSVAPQVNIEAPRSIKEGSILVTKLEALGLPKNSEIFWSLKGEGINKEDFVESITKFNESFYSTINSLQGSVMVDDDFSFILESEIYSDYKDENNELLQIEFYYDEDRLYQLGSTVNIIIEDTYLDSHEYIINSSHSIIQEGETIEIIFSVPNSSRSLYYWEFSGEGITASDFVSGELLGSDFLDNSGQFTVKQTISNDSILEDRETLNINLFEKNLQTEKLEKKGEGISIIIDDNITTDKIIGKEDEIVLLDNLSEEIISNLTLDKFITSSNIENKAKDITLTITNKFSDYDFINLGDSRYGISQKGTQYIDEITDYNNLLFSDKEINLSQDIKATFDQLTGLEDNSGQIFRLYNAAFSRFPDPEGLSYWINIVDSEVNSKKQIANSFLISQEFEESYGKNISNDIYIKTLYSNVLDRSPDLDGLNYWLERLETGSEDRVDVLLGIAESSENKSLFSSMTGIF